MGRFLSQKDMSTAKYQQEVLNSRLKRKEIPNPENIVRTHHVVCGCGDEGCIFMHVQYRK
jgi:hypothetical protein